MSYADKHIVEAYVGLFEGLSPSNQLELIERLSKSVKKKTTSKDKAFYKSFGAFGSDKTADTIVIQIKSSRKFKE
jgi:hypothetical protein